MIRDVIKKNQTAFFIGGIILGVAIIVLSAILIGILLSQKLSVIGPWYNEGLGQQLRFADEDSVIITTAAGVVEAKYSFDKKSGEGVISINGQGIKFYRKDGSIFLVGGNGETEYSKGELPANVLSTVKMEETTVTTTEATTAATTESVTETTASVTETAGSSVTVTPTPTPSATPTPTITPTVSPTPIAFTMPSYFTINDPFLPILGTPVVGTWFRQDDSGAYLNFRDDGKVEKNFGGLLSVLNPYTYDMYSGEGFILTAHDGDVAFTVTGDILVCDFYGGTFQRED